VERYSNLTQYERDSLGRPFNLADGHARQYQDDHQLEICRRLPDLYRAGERISQLDVEGDFQAAFYGLAGQLSATGHPRALLCTSASLATDLVATFFGHAQLSVGLVQPCFDNLAAIMRRRGVRMTPLSEAELLAPEPGRPSTDALFVALPNNPTGFVLDRAEFADLAARCARRGQILILDWTFRFFSSLDQWDQYAILEQTGVSYLCIEDTGKTWPSLDLKCSMLAASADLFPHVADIHSDVLLNVSPFTLLLLLEYMQDSGRRGLDLSVRRPVDVNRRRLRKALRESVLAPIGGQAAISVEWVRIDSDEIDSTYVVDLLAHAGIGILPGDLFFWAHPWRGREYIRFALARDPATFDTVCHRIEGMITRLEALRRGPLVA
jgi:aspartate/methionine/tyrosine aminotransferase